MPGDGTCRAGGYLGSWPEGSRQPAGELLCYQNDGIANIVWSDESTHIIAYLDAVNGDDTESPGGLELGGLGPVSEGLFGWVFGLGALIAVAVWVAARTAKAKKS